MSNLNWRKSSDLGCKEAHTSAERAKNVGQNKGIAIFDVAAIFAGKVGVACTGVDDAVGRGPRGLPRRNKSYTLDRGAFKRCVSLHNKVLERRQVGERDCSPESHVIPRTQWRALRLRFHRPTINKRRRRHLAACTARPTVDDKNDIE